MKKRLMQQVPIRGKPIIFVQRSAKRNLIKNLKSMWKNRVAMGTAAAGVKNSDYTDELIETGETPVLLMFTIRIAQFK